MRHLGGNLGPCKAARRARPAHMKLPFPRLVTAITLCAIFAMAARVSVDTDTWWHLRTGQWIVEHHAVPQTDPFSYTRAGAEWKIPGWIGQFAVVWVFVHCGCAR